MRLTISPLKHLMYTMSILLSMTSCSWYEEEEEVIYDRTVLVYMAAENTLSSFAQEDIDEMVQAAGKIPKNSRLFVYVDNYSLPKILSIEVGEEGSKAKTIYQYTEEHNSGDPETLTLAMDWIITNSPSESYGLVLWSHGEAWIPTKAPAQRAVCQDSGSKSWMEIPEIAEALTNFPKLEFILFDACFMQSIEVAYELRNTTNYIIGSPAEIPAPGAPYNRIVEAMFSSTNCADSIAENYYKEYSEGEIAIQGNEPETYGVCLSVVDCSQLELLAKVTKETITKYISTESEIELEGAQRYYLRDSSTRPEYYDMNGYMKRLLTNIEDYTHWSNALDRAVSYKRTTPHWYSYDTGMEKVDIENYSGISCYVPKNTKNRTKLNTKFQTTSWYQATGWEKWYPNTESSATK